MIWMPNQTFKPYLYDTTFNCNGNLGLNQFRMEENSMQVTTLNPWIIPFNGCLRYATFSGVVSGAPDCDIAISKNGSIETVINVTAATSVHDINIAVAAGDRISLVASTNMAPGDDFTDSILTLFSYIGMSAPAILTPLHIFGSSLGWWFRGGDWSLTGTDIDTLDNLEGTASRDATGTSETAAFKPQAVVEDGLDACRFEGIDASSRREFFTWDTDFEALTECELFAVQKLDADPPAAGGNTGMWDTGTSLFPTNYPWIDSTIYDEAGRTTQFTTGNPATSLTTQHCYNVRSNDATPIWANYLNGNNVITSSAAAFTYGFPATGRWGAGAAVFMQGYGWELIGLNTLATNPQRNLLGVYFADRGYSFTFANF